MEADTLSKSDSMVLKDVKSIAQYIQQDSFWTAEVAQVDITPQHTYEMIPVLGNQVINLGGADGLDTKFKKLYAFYRQVWSKTGFEKYARVDVQYEGQVVAVKRGVALQSDSAQQYGNGATRDSLYAGIERRERSVAARDSVTTANRHAHTAPARRGQTARPVRNRRPARRAN
jgi:cell division protein FtsQ